MRQPIGKNPNFETRLTDFGIGSVHIGVFPPHRASRLILLVSRPHFAPMLLLLESPTSCHPPWGGTRNTPFFPLHGGGGQKVVPPHHGGGTNPENRTIPTPTMEGEKHSVLGPFKIGRFPPPPWGGTDSQNFLAASGGPKTPKTPPKRQILAACGAF